MLKKFLKRCKGDSKQMAVMALQDQQHLQSDECPCCRKSRSTYDANYWNGTLDHLHNAALHNCPRCALLARCIRGCVPDAFSRGGSFRAWENFTCELRLTSQDPNQFEEPVVLDIFAIASQHRTQFKYIKSKTLLSGSTSSQKTFETIRLWMKECLHDHIACTQAPDKVLDPSQLPTRILDLRNDHIKLQEFEQLSDGANYACLSHCWGPSQDVIKTTTFNLPGFMNDIEWAIFPKILPKTFKNAIDACRRLRIDFLWIDSLCIVQNSKEDWILESMKMASIYQNAFLTVAATRAKQSSDGLYATTDPVYLARLLKHDDIYVRRKPPTYPTHWSEVEAETWPLFTRGWIYQEMRFSRRVLHFCSEEVIWECRCSRRSESGCSDKDLAADQGYYAHQMYDAVPYWKLAENPSRLWYRTVQEYSRLRLTYSQDKLPGLAGLTQQMQDLKSNDRFLAGLWEETLLLDLLWMAWPSPKLGRPDTWLAPTWSWASIQNQVMWEQTSDTPLAGVHVVRVVCSYTGAAEMGFVSDKSGITLHAPMIRATWTSSGLCLNETLDSANHVAVQDFKDDYNFTLPGPHHIPPGSPLVIVPLGISRENHHHSGLVLRKKHRTSSYERIGYVQLWDGAPIYAWGSESYHDPREKLAIPSLEPIESILTGLPYSDIDIV